MISPNDLHVFPIKLKYEHRKLKNDLKMAFKNSVKKNDKKRKTSTFHVS